MTVAGDAMGRLALMGALRGLRGATNDTEFEALARWASRRTSLLGLRRGRPLPVLDCPTEQ